MKLATWNVNSLSVRLPQVLEWLAAQAESAPVDALALQETKLTDDKFPHAEIEAAGFHIHWRAWVADELLRHPQLVLMGDFNIAPEDRDVFDPVAWAGQIHCTPEERAHFQALLDLGLVDAFRLFAHAPKS